MKTKHDEKDKGCKCDQCVAKASAKPQSRADVVRAEGDAVWAAWSDAARLASAEARRAGMKPHEEHDAAADEHFSKAENQNDYHWRAGEAHAATAMALRDDVGGLHFNAARAHKAAGAVAKDAADKELHGRFYKLHADKAAAHGRSSPMGGHHLANASDPADPDAIKAAWSDAARQAALASRRAHAASAEAHEKHDHSDLHRAATEAHREAQEAHIAAAGASGAAGHGDHHRRQAKVHETLADHHADLAEEYDQPKHYDKSSASAPPEAAAVQASGTSEGAGMAQDAVHCRSGSGAGAAITATKPWSPGEQVRFMWMPAGVHTVCAGFRDGWVELTVRCDERTAEAAQASLDRWRAQRPEQEPYGCVEHREQEASVRVAASHGFEWGADGKPGVYITAEPTTLGAANVNGKVHRSWSPSFFTDAEYDRAQVVATSSGKTLVFPDGVRGSRSNPAEIVGIDFCLGTLTNKPAFHAMAPVRSSEGGAAVQAAGTHESVMKAWRTRKAGGGRDVYAHLDAHLSAHSGMMHSRDANHIDHDIKHADGSHEEAELIAERIAAAVDAKASKRGPITKAAGPATLDAIYAAQEEREARMAKIYEAHGCTPLELVYARHGDVRAEGMDAVAASGTSEGAKKGWQNRFQVGQKVRFDGKSHDGRAQGFFEVEVVEPHSNSADVSDGSWEHFAKNKRLYNKDGSPHIPRATVKNLRSGNVFEAYHHTLK